jgi:putative Mg2+ transporter-C (MgtC) family protein
MEELWNEFLIDWPAPIELARPAVRLIFAALVGAVPGIQRERVGTPAGMRTHILVSLGAALFVLSAVNIDATPDAITRVIQGIATGIGFVGAGAIVKSSDPKEVRGLTTAASIWMTAALGTAAGAGRIWLAVVGSILGLLVLSLLQRMEAKMRKTT